MTVRVRQVSGNLRFKHIGELIMCPGAHDMYPFTTGVAQCSCYHCTVLQIQYRKLLSPQNLQKTRALWYIKLKAFKWQYKNSFSNSGRQHN